MARRITMIMRQGITTMTHALERHGNHADIVERQIGQKVERIYITARPPDHQRRDAYRAPCDLDGSTRLDGSSRP
jgi:hypothetical protein